VKENLNRRGAVIPRFLYKYRSLDEFTSRMLIDVEVFFASPAKLNDPFDSGAHYTLSAPTDSQRDALRRRMIEQGATDVSDKVMDYELSRHRDEHAQKANEILHGRLGVFCMSEKNDDILMWSHYANSHRGICVRLDTQQFLTVNRNKIYRVTYCSKYPTYALFDETNDPLDVILTKSPHWKYEREWRAVHSPSRPVRLPKSAISAIILGCRISESEELCVRAWIGASSPRPTVLRARKKPSEYGLDIVPA